jgi:hypothetical protein
LQHCTTDFAIGVPARVALTIAIKGDRTSEGTTIEAESEKLCNTLLKQASFEGGAVAGFSLSVWV